MDPVMVLGHPQVDASDPIVVGASWLLTAAIGKYGGDRLAWLRPWLPWVAAAIALGLRAVIDASTEGLTVDTALRAFASGAAAVWSHSAGRSAGKDRQRRKAKRRAKGPQ